MKRFSAVRMVLVALLLGWSVSGFAQQPPRGPIVPGPYAALAPRVKATLRYATELSLAAGGPVVQVKIYSWHIAPQQDIPSFPLEGFATIEVRAGEVATELDGQITERREGDQWAVPEGARLRLWTGNDSVSLHGVVVIRR